MENFQTEEQQVEAIKSFWSSHGNSIIAGIVLGIAGYVGFNYYVDGQIAAEQQVSNKYEEINKLIAVNEDTYVAQAKKFVEENNGSNYAHLTTLNLAKIAADKKEWSQAETYLKQAVASAPSSTLTANANLRLARVQIQLAQYDAALATLALSFPESYKAQVAETKGDALLLKGDTDAARSAYQAAVDADGLTTSSSLQMKLDDLAQTVNLAQ